MRFWVVAVVLLVMGTVACQRSKSSCSPADLEKQKLANQIRHKVAAKLKQETKLCPCGTIGQMLRKVEVLGLSFNYYDPVDIVEGRKLLIKAVNLMMEEVNQEARIRPYLCRYPFVPGNVEIAIFIRSPEGRDVAPGALWIVEACEGFLYYKIRNPATQRLTDVYKETYEEALERLNDPSLPLAAFQPDPAISQEELARLRKGISFVADDGSIWHLGDDYKWVK